MKKIKKFFSDFKTFISRGNVLDMAVGVIIAGAFSAIVTALTIDFDTFPIVLALIIIFIAAKVKFTATLFIY